jgi:hypothetical protein
MGWLLLLLLVYVVGFIVITAVVAVRTESDDVVIRRALLLSIGFMLVLIPGHPPLPMPLFLGALVCSMDGCGDVAELGGVIFAGLLTLLVQSAAVVVAVRWAQAREIARRAAAPLL